MVRKKEILTAIGTLGCAVGIGFIMQSSDSAERRYGAPTAELIAPVAQQQISTGALLNVEAITLTAAEFSTGLDQPFADNPVIAVAAPQDLLPNPEPLAPVPACEITASARPIAAAMVNLTLDAACLPQERVTVHHNGMIFSQVTSETGQLDISVPALSANAVFILAFSNGEGAVAQTIVDDIKDYDRVALQWKGQSGFEIHAREFGAAYGAQGHIWKNAPGEIADAVTGQGGFLFQLGDPLSAEPLLAEVYSFPREAADRAGVIALSIETEISQANCGLEIEAQALEVSPEGPVKTRDLTLSVPECDAIGDFLVLNNLLQDLKVASK